MNKSILMSIQPQWVCEIFNGEKTIEVRKKFPKDYVGWVYIYCTKGKENLYKDYYVMSGKKGYFLTKCGDAEKLNGKVVARFWCDKVEEIECRGSLGNYEGLELNQYYTDTMEDKELFKNSCLKLKDFNDYLDNGKKIGYAIHISKLEVFDKLKELKSFVYYSKGNGSWCSWLNCIYLEHTKEECENCKDIHLQKAPQSWCYIEGE